MLDECWPPPSFCTHWHIINRRHPWSYILGYFRDSLGILENKSQSIPSDMASTTLDNSASNIEQENLYHVVLTASHMQTNPNGELEKIRVLGTYVSLAAAKIAAHSCLFDAGYEKEWLTKYETRQEDFESENIHPRTGLAVLAIAPDGTTFRVRILTTANLGHLTTDYDDGRIASDLYYVIQATFDYDHRDDRSINVEGVFKTYKEARMFAGRTLLSEEDGITKESFAEYDEAKENGRDCGFGENVVVHAVSVNGENYLVSVLKSQAMESVRLAEAAMRIF